MDLELKINPVFLNCHCFRKINHLFITATQTSKVQKYFSKSLIRCAIILYYVENDRNNDKKQVTITTGDFKARYKKIVCL